MPGLEEDIYEIKPTRTQFNPSGAKVFFGPAISTLRPRLLDDHYSVSCPIPFIWVAYKNNRIITVQALTNNGKIMQKLKG